MSRTETRKTRKWTPTRGALLLFALSAVVACSSSDEDAAKPGTGNPSEIKPAAQGGVFKSPFDATPDADGKVIYFTALTPADEPAVFKVPAAGGEVVRLFAGSPLGTPFGIAITEDGKKLVIADADGDRGEEAEGGAIYTLSTEGGSPAPLAGTEGFAPRGLELAGDDVVFSGRGADRKPGVFRVSLAGGAPAPVAVGAPFEDPSGIAVRKNGEIFVADSSPEGGVGAAVLRIKDGKTEILKTGIAVGHPAGLALSQDENAVLISGIAEATGTDVVYRFDLGTGETKVIDDVIKDFQESAGLHRAKRSEVYAWADSRANGGGTVYVLTGK